MCPSSPANAHSAVLNAYFSPEPNSLDRLVDSAYALQLEANGFGKWNPTLTQQLSEGRSIYVELEDGWSQATVSEVHKSKTLVTTAHGSFRLRNTNNFTLQPPFNPHLPLHKMTAEDLLPQLSTPPQIQASPPIPQRGSFIGTCSLALHIGLPSVSHFFEIILTHQLVQGLASPKPSVSHLLKNDGVAQKRFPCWKAPSPTHSGCIWMGLKKTHRSSSDQIKTAWEPMKTACEPIKTACKPINSAWGPITNA